MSKEVVKGELNPNAINEDLVSSYLSTADYPDPELLIRTSGENRVSNFLMWQLAYTELYFTDILWPDFKRKTFIRQFMIINKEREDLVKLQNKY